MTDILQKFPRREIALPLFAIVSVLAILFQLPNWLMDFALSVNLAISALIFLGAFFIRKPLDFSAFPTILLVTTLYRLVLNVSTTRLILTQGDAGQVVDSFSRFVAGNDVIVGGVIFAIFVIIQFVVITKGSTRISEVSARFALDALPGRQSAIDFDLNAGNITADEARARREELAESADFFGAMDGASKFVRGDAIAGLAIVLVNIIGGLCLGVMQKHMSLSDAASLYTRLTIGDGLVSQLPAFLISLATGLLVARTSRSQSLSEVATRQTLGRPIVLAATGIFLLALSGTGLPIVPLVLLAAGCFALAWSTSKTSEEEEEKGASGATSADARKAADKADEEDAELTRILQVAPFELTIGVGLTSLAAPENGPSLLERVGAARRALAMELGVVLPKARVRDDAALDDNQFVISVDGEEAYRGIAYPRYSLAVATPYAVAPAKGLRARTVDGRDAYWVDEKNVESAEAFGYEIWSCGDFLERSALAVARREAPALLTRDATKRLVERLRATSPALVDEALGTEPDPGKLARIQRALKLLLREGVSIRRLDLILESLNDLAAREPDANAYRAAEYARTRLGRSIGAKFRDEDGEVAALALDPEWEDALRASLESGRDGEPIFNLAPDDGDALDARVRASLDEAREEGSDPILLVDRDLRLPLANLLRDRGLSTSALAFDEVSGLRVRRAGSIARA